MKGLLLISWLFISLCSFSQNTINTSYAGVTFKVQIGAFSKSKPQIFDDIDSLSTYVMPNSLTKYLSGGFKTYEEALSHKKELLEKNYLGTFIVCFKEGMIIPISSLNISVNQTMVHLLNDIKVVSEELKKEAFLNNQDAIDRIEYKSKRYKNLDPSIMFYRVQIGSYKKEVPLEVMEKFNQLKDLIFMYEGNKGDTIYTTGKFRDSNQAYEHLKDLESIQFKGLKIVGIHDKQVIPYSVSKKLLQND